jgi:DNA-binding transcriptional LysR family regulator
MTTMLDFLLRRLRLRHIHLLALLGDHTSLRAAAETLNLTQPAVSKMLHEIEQAFGVRLFNRGRRGVEPNAFGRSVIHRALVVMSELAHSIDEVQATQGGASAIVRVGTLSITSIVPAAIIDLMRRLPGVCVQIHEGSIRELLDLLLDAKLDCVFGALPPEVLARDSLDFVRSEVIFEDHVCAVMSDDNPLSRKRRLHWKDLVAQKWVLPPRSSPVCQAFIAAFLNQGLPPPRPVVETLSPVTLGMLLRLDSSLVGLVRYESVRRNDAFRDGRRVEIDPKAVLPSLCVLTRRSAVKSAEVVELFIESLRQVARPGVRRP